MWVLMVFVCVLNPHSTPQDVATYLVDVPAITANTLSLLRMLRDPEAQNVVRDAIRKALPIEGVSEEAAAVALGDVSLLPDELDPESRVTIYASAQRLLDLAAAIGDKAMVKALLLRRFSPTQGTMVAALRSARASVVPMLSKKVPLGAEAACAVPADAPEIFDLVREAFPVSEWPVNTEEFIAFVSYGTRDLDVLLEYVGRLAAAGAPFNSTFVYNFLTAVGVDSESDALIRLFDLLEIDWNAEIEHGYSDVAKTLLEYVVQEHPVASVAAFAERQLLRPVHIEAHYPDATEKSSLIEARGVVAAEPTIAEYLVMGGAAIRVERLGILATKDGCFAGLRIGATEDDVRAVPLPLKGARVKVQSPGGTIMEESTSAHHRLSVELKKRKVRSLEYAATFPEGDPRPAELTAAIRDLWSDAFGKAKGRKNLKWSTDECAIEVSTRTSKASYDDRLGSTTWSVLISRP